MQKRRLGRTDLSIAPVVFGGNVFGWTADAKTAFDLLDRFRAAGLDAIDTADVYSSWAPGNVGGESETIIGDWLRSRGARSAMTIVTKVGSSMGPGKKGLSARYVEQAVEASLKRLGVETIDLYLSHWPDDSVPHAETLGAYQRLIDKGKIRWCGASNFSAARFAAALEAARAQGLPRYEVLQPEYNLYDRGGFEGALKKLCVAEEIGVITYYSLAKGFLAGKYRTPADLGQSPRGGGIRGYLNPRGLRIVGALASVAERHGAKSAEVALAWLIAQPGVTAPIASATSLAQVDSLIRAATLALSADDLAALDSAAAPAA
jgi:aryl-alcohol dehydrogenase-like predicted oxidoreductase